jgi:ABC-type amino acid transport system permease subunit
LRAQWTETSNVASQHAAGCLFEQINFACEYPRHACRMACNGRAIHAPPDPLQTWMETNVVLYGFGPVLLAGTIQTIELSVLSLAAAVLLGLAGAAAKLSLNRPLRMIGTAYTTLIRSVPDLVLML